MLFTMLLQAHLPNHVDPLNVDPVKKLNYFVVEICVSRNSYYDIVGSIVVLLSLV